MATLSLLLSFLLKKVGNLVQVVLGWSVTALFGRLPAARQLLLTVALVLSVVWPLLVLGVVWPAVAGWGIALLPVQHWVGSGALRVLWASLSALTPILVGVVVHLAAPRGRTSALRTIVGGYPLTIAFFAAAVVVVITVPIIKLIAIARGWTDEHVYVEARAGDYDCVLRSLAEAFARAGLVPEITAAPEQMVLATTILRTLSRGAVTPIMTNDLRRIRSEGLELYLYPADLLLRGESSKVARVRAMMSRTRLDAHAYLVASPAAQHVQDELARLWQLVSDEEQASRPLGGALSSRVRDIFRELERTDVPYSEWVILESLVRRLERRLTPVGSGEAPRLDDESDRLEDVARKANGADSATNTDPVVSTKGSPMPNEPEPPRSLDRTSLDEVPIPELISRALTEVKDLARVEIELAKEDVRSEAKGAVRAAIGFGVGAAAGILAVGLLLLALVLAVGSAPWVPLLLAAGFAVLAAAGGAVGYAWLPKAPLEPTRRRLVSDVDHLKEHPI